jgi:uncharacterized protein YegL
MKEKNLKIVFVIDESGSMQGSEQDVIGGFNGFINRQKNENVGIVSVSLYKFNTDVSLVYLDVPINNIESITKKDYNPNGFTALYDAIGMAITETGNKLSANKSKHNRENVLIVIITDGQENASKEYTSQTVKSLISTHEKLLQWNFIYLGVGLKDFTDASVLELKNRAKLKKDNIVADFDKISDSCIRFSISPCMKMDSEVQELINDLNNE